MHLKYRKDNELKQLKEMEVISFISSAQRLLDGICNFRVEPFNYLVYSSNDSSKLPKNVLLPSPLACSVFFCV